MTIISTNVQNKPNPIKVTLKGFTAAYDGPPLKQDELQSKQKELQEELRQAEADNDPARAEPAGIELDTVIEELAKATGLQGRSRKMGDTAERARSAVTWRIRSAIKKIGAAHPGLGQHLSNSIRTGNFCVYSPESAIEWGL